MNRFLEIEPAGRAGLVAVRFLARGAYMFFHRPLREVAAGVVDLADLWPDRAGEWTDLIAAANSMPARVRVVEQLLLGLLSRNGRTEPAVEIGVSCRHLRRTFDRAVGLSPKEFARVSRFLGALQLLNAGNHRSLTDVALDCGFFDQAHFNHEFRELAGMSPGDLSTLPNVSFGGMADFYNRGGRWLHTIAA